MKTIKSILLIIGILLATTSCQKLVEGINDDPNKITPSDINADLFLTGAMLANTVAQGGHLDRVACMWSGQLIGFSSLYSNIYGYNISTAEAIQTWSRIYVGTIPNVRYIRENLPDDKLLVGMSKVIEAHAIGTAATLFGDIPYSEIVNPDIEDPKFDSQVDVFNSLIALLNDAISDLNAATSRVIPGDIYFEGDALKWKEVAYTLIARYYLQMKDYTSAYAAAQNGISSAAGTMKYTPRGDPAITSGDKNLFYEILAGSRTGDIGTGNSFMMQLLDTGNVASRNNAKTDETARFEYYKIEELSASANLGRAEEFEPQSFVSYQENLLILAECGARTIDFATGLGYLNNTRQYLNTGGFLNANFSGEPYQYIDYVAADFNSGGMENADGIDPTRALLREIIEERYISGFLTFMPFNDARRLRKSDADLEVPFPLNPSSATQYPERMPYSDDELNSNASAPDIDPGIYLVTEVNK